MSWAENSLILAAAFTSFPRSDSSTMKSLALEAEAAPTLPNRGLCFAQHLLHVLQAQYAAACRDLLQAAATAPMHGTSPAWQGSKRLLQQVSSPGIWSRQESCRQDRCHVLASVSLHYCSACPSPGGPARSPAREPFQLQAQAGELGSHQPPL